MTRPMASGVYDIPNIECHAISVVTNTTPIVAYRGAGRPEATAAIERAMDMFAAEIGMDPVEVRRMQPDPQVPRPAHHGDRPDLRRRRLRDRARQGARRGRLHRAAGRAGRGGGSPATTSSSASASASTSRSPAASPPAGDGAKIEVHDDGTATVYTGTSPHGQGHDTAWSMITTEQTGIPMDRITLVWGDTDLVPEGGGTMGSRSLQHGGAAVNQAADRARREGDRSSPRRCSRPTKPTSCSTRTPARSTSPARRRCRRPGPTSPRRPVDRRST